MEIPGEPTEPTMGRGIHEQSRLALREILETIFFAKSQVRSTVFCDFPRKLLSDTIQGLEKNLLFLLFWKSTPGKFGESARFEHNHKTSHNHVFWDFLICFVHDVGTYHKGLRVWNFGLIGWAEFLYKYLRAKLLGTRAERSLCWRLAAKKQWIFSRSWPFIVDFPTKNSTLC